MTYCPYCNKYISNGSNLMICDQETDHTYIHYCDNNWYLLHTKTQLFVDSNRICYNVSSSDLIEFKKEISPQEAVVILNKYLKLKAFI